MKTETETKEAGGEFSEIEVKSDVETVREADEDHLGHRTQANEEEGSIVLHAGNDMDEKDKIAISKVKIAMEYRREETNGEQTENVIETECLGEKIEKRQRRYGKKKADDEELPVHCTQTDEEASSIVFHVGRDMKMKQQQQKRHLNPMMRSQRKMKALEDLSVREEAHSKGRSND